MAIKSYEVLLAQKKAVNIQRNDTARSYHAYKQAREFLKSYLSITVIQNFTRELCLIFNHSKISQSIHGLFWCFLSESQFLGYECKEQKRMKD
jgi:hypothetical protein